ncbi:MAG: peptide deformylase [Deltaproteobacteria bacterium]|nr:peptide deformylase [Deltaproteobacteria bacterium]
MSILEVLKYPHPFLCTKAKPVHAVDSHVKALIEDMIDTMRYARGIGLAATQVGSDKRVIVLEVPEKDSETGQETIVLVNPEIIEAVREFIYEEGCLSLPGIVADVKRFEGVVVKGLDTEGRPFSFEAEGLKAVAVQHEIDHLDGVLFIDRLTRLKRSIVKKRYLKILEAEKALVG